MLISTSHKHVLKDEELFYSLEKKAKTHSQSLNGSVLENNRASEIFRECIESWNDRSYTTLSLSAIEMRSLMMTDVVLPLIINRSYCIRLANKNECDDVEILHLAYDSTEKQSILYQHGLITTAQKIHRILFIINLEDPSTILGMIHFYVQNKNNDQHCVVKSLNILESRKGLGILLVGCAYKIALEKRCRNLKLRSSSDAISFYLRLGFTPRNCPFEKWSNLSFTQQLKFVKVYHRQKRELKFELDLLDIKARSIFESFLLRALSSDYQSQNFKNPSILNTTLPSYVFNWGVIHREPQLEESCSKSLQTSLYCTEELPTDL